MSKFKYIKLSQVMASVEEDLPRYSMAGLIDSSKYIKVIRACNQKLGLRIYDSKQVILNMNNGKAELPEDFYKVEMAFGINTNFINTMLPFGPGATQVTTKPNFESDDLVASTTACLDEAGHCYWMVKTKATQLQFKNTEFVPLSLINNSFDCATEYSPNRSWGHLQKARGFEIDLNDNIIRTHLNGGCLFFSYLADMIDEDGEDIIPFDALLNPYYEWSIKVKILEDIMMNSEDDVSNKLKYAKMEKNFSFQDAVNFTMTAEAKEWQRYEQKRSREFFNKYYQIML